MISQGISEKIKKLGKEAGHYTISKPIERSILNIQCNYYEYHMDKSNMEKNTKNIDMTRDLRNKCYNQDEIIRRGYISLTCNGILCLVKKKGYTYSKYQERRLKEFFINEKILHKHWTLGARHWRGEICLCLRIDKKETLDIYDHKSIYFKKI